MSFEKLLLKIPFQTQFSLQTMRLISFITQTVHGKVMVTVYHVKQCHYSKAERLYESGISIRHLSRPPDRFESTKLVKGKMLWL